MNRATQFDLTEKDLKHEGRYNPYTAAEAILNQTTVSNWITPMNEKGGDVVWRYDANIGIYKPDGVPVIKQIIADVLGEKAKTRWINETVEFMKIATYTDPQKFEGPTEFIVCSNCTLEVTNQAQHRHSSTFYQKQAIPVKYDTTKDCPAIKQFINEVCPEEIETIQEWFGYHLLKDYRYQKAFIFTGKGANGKSTLFDLLTAFLGHENISNQSLYDLTSQRFSVVELHTRLANISPDVGTDELKRTGIFKALTGGDYVKAEKKGQDLFSFKNYAKLNFACNQLPTSPDESDAFFRRFMVFEFNRVFKEDEADPNIIEKLTTEDELSGLLNWALEGLNRLLERGHFKQTKTTEEMRQFYQELANPELSFRNNCLTENSEGMLSKDQMYNAYSNYCKTKGLVSCNKQTFTTELLKHIYLEQGQKTIDGSRVRVWLGCDLNCGNTTICTTCTTCTGVLYPKINNNLKNGVEKGVQCVQPVQDGLLKTGLTPQLQKLFSIIFDCGEPISEYELVDEHGYSDLDLLRKLLQVLARDNMIYSMRPGVWGVV